MMVIDTKESGRMTKRMDRASITLMMVVDTKESLSITERMVGASITIQMECMK